MTEFTSPAALDERLASEICGILQHEIQHKGYANLAVSGGRTPVNLFQLLSGKDLDWSRVNVTLADERWTRTTSKDSNELILRENLLQDKAAAARFIPLKQGTELDAETLAQVERQLREAQAFPFDVLTLGMGEDGHTASLFPSADEIYRAMDPASEELLCAVVPKTAPYNRVSFTLAALLRSRKIYLHLVGAAKLEVLNRADAGDNVMEMPVRAFLHNPDIDLEVYWSPR